MCRVFHYSSKLVDSDVALKTPMIAKKCFTCVNDRYFHVRTPFAITLSKA